MRKISVRSDNNWTFKISHIVFCKNKYFMLSFTEET